MSVAVPVIDYMDVTTLRIHLLQGVTEYHPVEDIYKEVRNLRKTDETLRVVSMPIFAFGNIAKGGGKYTPRYAQFNNGWRVIPFDELSTLYISGEQITDDGQSGPACMDMTSLVSAVTIHYEPPAAEIVRDEVSLAAINYMSYSDMVTIDIADGISGTVYPAGNIQYPSNNLTDAISIAEYNHITKFKFKHHGNVIDNDYDYTGYEIVGDAPALTSLYVDSLPLMAQAVIKDLAFSGTVDGGLALRDCKIQGVNFFSGSMRECGVDDNPIVLGGAGTAILNSCESIVPGANARPQIDFNGQPTHLAIRDWQGGLELTNKTNATGEVSIDMSSGILYIRSSCTAGEITVRGLGRLVDESGVGCVVKYDGLLDPAYVQYLTYAEYIWIDEDSDNTGTVYPVGTPSKPLNNWADAIALSSLLGIHQFMIHGATTIPSGTNLTGAILSGHHAMSSIVTIEDGATTGNTTAKYLTLQGTLSPEAGVVIEDAVTMDLNNFSGYMRRTALVGNLVLGGGRNTTLDMCFRGDRPIGDPPQIDMGGTGQSLGIRGWVGGGLSINNLDDPTQKISIDMLAGRLDLAADLLQGGLYMRGTGSMNDSGHSLTVIENELVGNTQVSTAVWDYLIEAGFSAADIMKIKAAALAGKASGAGTGTVTFKGLDGTTSRITAAVDGTGNRTNVTVNGS